MSGMLFLTPTRCTSAIEGRSAQGLAELACDESTYNVVNHAHRRN
jgi:hypothetical protein